LFDFERHEINSNVSLKLIMIKGDSQIDLHDNVIEQTSYQTF